jgi:hypothetical protein
MYATLFDKRYLSRGISMIESLLSFEKDAAISVLCLDLETEIAVRTLSKTLNVSPVSLSEIGDDLVSQIRGNRTYREFCWALSSVFCIHLLNQQNSEVIYIDADVYFFGNPKSLLEECRKGDIAAIRHRFPERLRQYEINGIYNVQWVYFANTKIGREACAVWAKQCIACSSYLPERGIIGDQKYLDAWPVQYPTFIDVQNFGAGVAPWNHEVMKPRKVNGEWTVLAGSTLVFYHFHGLKIHNDGRVTLAPKMYSKIKKLPNDLYAEYLVALNQTTERFSLLADNPMIDNKAFHKLTVIKKLLISLRS